MYVSKPKVFKGYKMKKTSNLPVKKHMDPLMLHITQAEQRHRVEAHTHTTNAKLKKTVKPFCIFSTF